MRFGDFFFFFSETANIRVEELCEVHERELSFFNILCSLL